MKALDLEAVTAFVVTADLQSFTRAAEVLDMTQSAVSVKVKRLEDALGRRLLERTPRKVRLSSDGSEFMGAARALVEAHRVAVSAFAVTRRRLLIGMCHHTVGSELPWLLRSIGDAEPGLRFEIRVAPSRELLTDFDTGALDVAIVLRHDSRRKDGKVILREKFTWIGSSDFVHHPGEPLRIATQPEPCSVRAMAVKALDLAGVSWTESFIGGGVNTIGAAVSAGLAVAAMGRRVAPAGTLDLSTRLGLPPLPARDLVMYTHVRDPQAKAVLHALGTAMKSKIHL